MGERNPKGDAKKRTAGKGSKRNTGKNMANAKALRAVEETHFVPPSDSEHSDSPGIQADQTQREIGRQEENAKETPVSKLGVVGERKGCPSNPGEPEEPMAVPGRKKVLKKGTKKDAEVVQEKKRKSGYTPDRGVRPPPLKRSKMSIIQAKPKGQSGIGLQENDGVPMANLKDSDGQSAAIGAENNSSRNLPLPNITQRIGEPVAQRKATPGGKNSERREVAKRAVTTLQGREDEPIQASRNEDPDPEYDDRSHRSRILKAVNSWGMVGSTHMSTMQIFFQSIGVSTVPNEDLDSTRPVARPFSQIREVNETVQGPVLKGFTRTGEWVYNETSGSVLLMVPAKSVGTETLDEHVQSLRVVRVGDGEKPRFIVLEEGEEFDYESIKEEQVLEFTLFYFKEDYRPVVPSHWKDEKGNPLIPFQIEDLGVVDGMVRLTVANSHNPKFKMTFVLFVIPDQQIENKPEHLSLDKWMEEITIILANHCNATSSLIGVHTFGNVIISGARTRSKLARSRPEQLVVVPREWIRAILRDSKPVVIVPGSEGKDHDVYWGGRLNSVYENRNNGDVSFLVHQIKEKDALAEDELSSGGLKWNRPCGCWSELKELQDDLPGVPGLCPDFQDFKRVSDEKWENNRNVVELSSREKVNETSLESIFAGEMLPCKKVVFTRNVAVPEVDRTEYMTQDVDLMFLHGRIEMKYNRLVHYCAGCRFDDLMVAHELADTTAIEYFQIRDDRPGVGERVQFLFKPREHQLQKLRSQVNDIVREAYPWIPKGTPPSFKKGIAQSGAELCAVNVFWGERRLMESVISGFVWCGVVARLDRFEKSVAAKETEANPEKLQHLLEVIGGFRECNQKDEGARTDPSISGAYKQDASPASDYALFSRAIRTSGLAVLACHRLCTGLLGLRSISSILQSSRCEAPDLGTLSAFTWYGMHGWHSRPTDETVAQWFGKKRAATVRISHMMRIRNSMLFDYDQAMIQVVKNSVPALKKIMEDALWTSEYDMDLWATTVSTLRGKKDDICRIGGDKFDHAVFKVLQESADGMEGNVWVEKRLALRIDRALTAIGHTRRTKKGTWGHLYPIVLKEDKYLKGLGALKGAVFVFLDFPSGDYIEGDYVSYKIRDELETRRKGGSKLSDAPKPPAVRNVKLKANERVVTVDKKWRERKKNSMVKVLPKAVTEVVCGEATPERKALQLHNLFMRYAEIVHSAYPELLQSQSATKADNQKMIMELLKSVQVVVTVPEDEMNERPEAVFGDNVRRKWKIEADHFRKGMAENGNQLIDDEETPETQDSQDSSNP